MSVSVSRDLKIEIAAHNGKFVDWQCLLMRFRAKNNTLINVQDLKKLALIVTQGTLVCMMLMVSFFALKNQIICTKRSLAGNKTRSSALNTAFRCRN